MAANGPILEMEGISKRFPGVVALDNVSLSVGTGAIVALIGEIGAGNSTLMKILGGAISRETGASTATITITKPSAPQDSACCTRTERLKKGSSNAR